MFPDYSYAQAAVDLVIGITIGCGMMIVLQVLRLSPFDLESDLEYDAAFGADPATRVPAIDEWLPWSGGTCPVERHTMVDLKFRDGTILHNTLGRSYMWALTHDGDDIVAYREAAR